MKRIFAILLALCLCLGACPPAALAAVTLRPSVNNPTITGTLSATAYGGIHVQDGSHKVKLKNASLPESDR